MAPRRAEAYVLALRLPPDEAAAVIEIDIHRKSRIQTAGELHVSPDGLSKIRRRAYNKILDAESAAPE